VHEMSIAASIYETCRDVVARRGGGRLESVRVAVGELSALEPELLVFAWQALTQGGADEGCHLDVEWRPARQTCRSCGEEKPRGPHSWLRLCPDCGQPLEVEGGDELDVLELSYVGYDEEGGDEP